MAKTQTVTVIEQTPVARPSEATAEISLPLTFLDIMWLPLPPIHRLIFYQHPISRTHFIDTLLPKLKSSLSLCLQHYSPLAGGVIVPPDNSILPEIRYKDGDTVPLVIAECNSSEGHFSHLTSNDIRSCSDFHPLVPSLPPTRRGSDGSIIVPVLALQVTLFPDDGICIGVTNHHSIGDASSIFAFMKAWAFFSSQGDEKSPPVTLPLPEFQPLFDRAVIKDGKGLGRIFWDFVKHIKIEDAHVHRLPLITNKVRATFLVTRDDIQRLKTHVLARRPKLVHVSSFTLISSYVWICLVKSQSQNTNEDEDVAFLCAADCRTRLHPPVPRNYFGNCVIPGCLVSTKAEKLVGEDGLAEAVEIIGEGIRKQLYNKEEDGALTGAEGWMPRFSSINFERTLSVSGSPKFDYYELDFGWGKPKKFEMPSIDLNGAMSLSTARDHEGGFEVGFSLPTTQMDTFTTIFSQGLRAI